MTELSYEVPTVGEKHAASDQRVSTALTEIKTVLNGRLTANNFAKETITPKKFVKPAAWTTVTFGKEVGPNANFEVAATSTVRDLLLSLVYEVGASVGGANATTIKVGGAVIGKVHQIGGLLKKPTIAVGPFRVPPNEAVLIEVPVNGGTFGAGSIVGSLVYK